MISWITDSLGTASYYDEKIGNSPNAVIIDVRELTDKEGNTADFVRSKVQAIQDALQAKKNVVVCCDKGISRSNAIALGALIASGMSYESAVELLADKVGISNINLGLLHDVRDLFINDQKFIQKSSPNILVTGSTGLVGRVLTDGLREEFKLFCPGREELSLTDNLPFFDLYVNKNEIDFIIHLAHPQMRTSVSGMTEAIAMMKNILEVCRLNKLGLLYLSGLVVFSGYISDTPLAVDSALEPLPKGSYGETKYLCEELIKLYQRNYGLDATILRPAALYGKGIDRSAFIYKFFEAAKQGATVRTHRYRNGPPIFDFLYLDDLVGAIRLALQFKPGNILNIGTGIGTSTYELAQTITEIMSSSSTVEMINIADETAKIIVDTSEAKTYLKWEATTSLQTGLKELWAWIKKQ